MMKSDTSTTLMEWLPLTRAVVLALRRPIWTTSYSRCLAWLAVRLQASAEREVPNDHERAGTRNRYTR